MKKIRTVFHLFRRFRPWLAVAVGGLALAAGVGLYALFYPSAAPASDTLEIVPSDSFNMLIVLTDRDTDAPLLFALAGLDAPDKCLTILPLPAKLSVQGGTLQSLFTDSGSTQTAAACAQALGVPVDYYWVQGGASFARMIDQSGGVDCSLPTAVDTRVPHGAQVQLQSGSAHLNGVQTEAALCYMSGTTEQAEKLKMQGAVLQAVARKTCTAESLDPDAFGNWFDMAKTDFSMNDLLSKTKALKQVSTKNGHVDVLLPALQESGAAASLSAGDRQQTAKAFGSQNRRYAP